MLQDKGYMCNVEVVDNGIVCTLVKSMDQFMPITLDH